MFGSFGNFWHGQQGQASDSDVDSNQSIADMIIEDSQDTENHWRHRCQVSRIEICLAAAHRERTLELGSLGSVSWKSTDGGYEPFV